MSAANVLLLVIAAAAIAAIWAMTRGSREDVLLEHFPGLASMERTVSLVFDPLLGAGPPSDGYRDHLNLLVKDHETLLLAEQALNDGKDKVARERLVVEKLERKLAAVRTARLFPVKRTARTQARYNKALRRQKEAEAETDRGTAAIEITTESIRGLAAALATERAEWRGPVEVQSEDDATVERNTLLLMFFDHVRPSAIERLFERYGLTVVGGTAKLSLFLVRSGSSPAFEPDDAEATRLDVLADRLRQEPIVEAVTQNMPLDGHAVVVPDPVVLASFPQAWSFTASKGAQGPIEVGVLDVGFGPESLDLKVVPLAGVPNRSKEHGTQVAAIIGAVRGNSIGIDGAVPAATIVGASPTKAFVFDFNDVLVRMLARTPALRVINASVGHNWKSRSIVASTSDAVKKRVKNAGVVIRKTLLTAKETLLVTSAGNDSSSSAAEPAMWASPYNWAALEPTTHDGYSPSENVVVVEAMDAAGGRLADSNTGGTMKVVGASVRTITSSMQLTAQSGTSFAAPLVTSAVALMLQVNPKLTVKDLKDKLGVGSTDPTLNAFEAVKRAAQ